MSCQWHQQEGSPLEVLTVQRTRDRGCHWKSQVRAISGLSGWANLLTSWSPQHEPPHHDQEILVSPHQWARTTGDVFHPEQAPDCQPGLVHPSLTRQLEGDYGYSSSTILTKTAEEHSGRAAISDPNSQGQERFPQRLDCKSPHCAQAENVQVSKALWPLCHLQQKSRAWNWYKPLSRPTLSQVLCGSTNLHQQTSGGQFSLILPVAPTILPTRENQELSMSTQDSHVQTASSTNLA